MKGFSKLGIGGVLNTLYLNFRYLKFKDAIHLPILATSKVQISSRRGNIIFNAPPRRFMLYLGADRSKCYNTGSILNIKGKLEICGSGFHVVGVGSNIIVQEKAVLKLGNNLAIGHHFCINCRERIEIGDNFLCSHNVTIRDNDGHGIYSNDGKRLNPDSFVQIGDKVWIAANCMVLKGCSIPNGSIIGAKSLVTKNTFLNMSLKNDNYVFAGNPAKLIKVGITWDYN